MSLINGSMILTDEEMYPGEKSDRTAALIATRDINGAVRFTVVDPVSTAVVYVNYDNSKRLVDFLTEEFDL